MSCWKIILTIFQGEYSDGMIPYVYFIFMNCRYFRKDNLFGLACFENMPVESEIERGARMKSVGIMATSYTLLYRHMQFLETQVR